MLVCPTRRSAFQHGYAHISVSDIVAHAHISRNVFYSHFSDKGGAAAEAIRTNFEAAMQAAAHAFFAEDPWPERLWRGGYALTSHFFSNPQLAYLTLVELHAIRPEVTRIAHERLMAFTLLFEEGYRQHPGAHFLPRLASEVLAAAVFELEYLEVPRKLQTPTRDYRGERAYICLAPFMGPEAAGEFVAGKAAAGR
ncbi:MAG TPA: TetR/AcrR family transcriptional regulator [Solirubrobacteraceae bacterium]|jgi:AcrR family transcriptional regulator|nr:TetR/AcrR family transcriptional regulator [Solirubrobacteraceae bacterium]